MRNSTHTEPGTQMSARTFLPTCRPNDMPYSHRSCLGAEVCAWPNTCPPMITPPLVHPPTRSHARAPSLPSLHPALVHIRRRHRPTTVCLSLAVVTTRARRTRRTTVRIHSSPQHPPLHTPPQALTITLQALPTTTHASSHPTRALNLTHGEGVSPGLY